MRREAEEPQTSELTAATLAHGASGRRLIFRRAATGARDRGDSFTPEGNRSSDRRDRHREDGDHGLTIEAPATR
jgi:hypothetical protein